MASWSHRVDDLLFEGESVTADVACGTATVVVTSHRVLAFTPDRDGANFRQVDRPNVAGVSVGTDGQMPLLLQAGQAGALGAVLLVAGLFVSFDGLVGDVDLSTGGELGIGGILGMVRTMMDVLGMLDDLMRAAGAIALLTAVALAGAYRWTRERYLRIEVAGEERDIRLPVPDDRSATVDRLERAMFPDRGGDTPPPSQASDPIQ
jgi:hypothetical protein